MIFYFQCKTRHCRYYDELVIIQLPEMAPGVYEQPHPICVCNRAELAQVHVREYSPLQAMTPTRHDIEDALG